MKRVKEALLLSASPSARAEARLEEVSIVPVRREGVRQIGQGDRRHKSLPAPSNAADDESFA
jgi:hypothetical protein